VIVFFNTIIDYCQLKIAKRKGHNFYGAFCLGGQSRGTGAHLPSCPLLAPPMAKRLRRRLEHRYHHTRLDVNKKAFFDARCATRTWQHHEVSCWRYLRQTSRGWGRYSRHLANSAEVTSFEAPQSKKPPVYQNDAECAACASLSLAFSKFFVDKINRLRDSITTALQLLWCSHPLVVICETV